MDIRRLKPLRSAPNPPSPETLQFGAINMKSLTPVTPLLPTLRISRPVHGFIEFAVPVRHIFQRKKMSINALKIIIHYSKLAAINVFIDIHAEVICARTNPTHTSDFGERHIQHAQASQFAKIRKVAFDALAVFQDKLFQFFAGKQWLHWPVQWDPRQV